MTALQDLLAKVKVVVDWADDVLAMTDPDDEYSYFCDQPRECAEAIAFDESRSTISSAITELRALIAQEEGK